MHFPQGVSIFKSGLYSTIISLPDNKLSDLKAKEILLAYWQIL